MRQRAILGRLPGTVFGVFDAARDAAVLSVLTAFGGECRSLFAGEEGRKLAAFAPYLVELPASGMLLRVVIEEGWGKSWGIFASGDCSFDEARTHLRSLLLAKNAKGEQFYFRYYDPRVLREFLPACRLDDLPPFYGPLQCFAMEDANPRNLLLFQRQRREPESIPVGAKK
ncbi:MAG: DUF4123 domain-containing protein [Bryobacteraceae bacterium]